jgi:hypothetical protein
MSVERVPKDYGSPFLFYVHIIKIFNYFFYFLLDINLLKTYSLDLTLCQLCFVQ